MTRRHQRNIDALLSEDRVFEPPEAFRARALVYDRSIYERAEADPEGFWAEQAERLTWFKRWDTVMEWDAAVGEVVRGRHAQRLLQLPRPPRRGRRRGQGRLPLGGRAGRRRARSPTGSCYEEVCRFANALKALGVRKGDRVAIYLGHGPELPVAMLACARIGAAALGRVRRVLRRGAEGPDQRRGGEGPDHRRRRLPARPGRAAQGERRRGGAGCPSIEHVVTVRRTGGEHPFTAGRDLWYHDLVADQPAECEPEPMDAEDLLYLLYTSGTTGKPKGIAHTTGGYLTQVAATHRHDLRHPRGRRVLVRGRHRLGHRPLVHRVRAAREPHHRDHLRGRARLARQGSALGDRGASTAPRSSTRRRRRSARSCGGAPSSPRSTTCRRCGCSARSASRSIPRRGSGTGSTSAASAARSSTPGGRRRPARS